LFYVLALSMRFRPTVKSLQTGHDEYLKNINPTNRNANSPNVLFILMDDMAYSDISCYSYLNKDGKAPTINTPTLDALAEEGVSFENFYACSPVCSPSRFGILTGRYASRGYLDNVVFPTTVSMNPFGSTRYFNPFQFYNNVDGILGDEITFAEVLQAAGYNTALIGKWNLGDYGEYLPTNQGFDYFYGSYYVNDMTPYNMVREVGGVAEEVHSHWDMLDQSETTKILSEELDSYITDASAEYKESGQPFLAYYCTPWPHYPIFSGNKYDTTDDSYIACIEEFDEYLGHTIDLLKEQGVYDDTLIVFTSDNGPGREGVTGALRGRKNTTFDGGHKVPLIMSYPNSNIGNTNKVITTNAMNIDLFPTILQYAGITNMPTDRIIDGVSMYDILEEKNGTFNNPSYRLHDALYYIKKGKVQGIQMPIETVDKQGNPVVYDYKYFDKVRTENSAFIDQVYKNYLFNLTLDPAEGYNVSMTYPEVAQLLNNNLGAFRKSLKKNRRGIL
ncbi:MAG: sulfatase-like hydrolase/transferase, partial [Clostridia bacterium]|nr:sulfatase-like hydrolase/transferase [Clostridia bacterium]